MRDFMKITALTIIGLAVAVVLYPFMHESGHTLATLLFGGAVVEFTLFPLPSVLSDISQISNIGLVLIGLSGIMFPLIISVAIHPQKFYLWYSAFVFKGIVLLSLVLSGGIVVVNAFGFTDANDDMIKTLMYWQGGTPGLFLILIATTLITAISIYREHPIKRICKNFGI